MRPDAVDAGAIRRSASFRPGGHPTLGIYLDLEMDSLSPPGARDARLSALNDEPTRPVRRLTSSGSRKLSRDGPGLTTQRLAGWRPWGHGRGPRGGIVVRRPPDGRCADRDDDRSALGGIRRRPMPAIEVEDLFKSYGRVDAVRGISFGVQEGEVFALLGPEWGGQDDDAGDPAGSPAA